MQNTHLSVYVITLYLISSEDLNIQWCEKVFAPFLFFVVFYGHLSHLNDSDHQTNVYITQR